MKKFISLFLCAVLVCFAFTGCKKTVIGEDLENREDNTDKNTRLESLNMYVIVGDDTAAQAKETVPTNINVYLKETYEIQLNIIYCKASEYEKAVMDSLADGVPEENRADIVLINSVDMFNNLLNANKLAPLTSFYNSKDYQKLNAIVEDKLLASSLVTVTVPGVNGAPDTVVSDYYTVPNNHRIGEYKYIVIDKAQARDKLHNSTSRIEAMNDQRDIEQYKSSIGDQYVSLVAGNYETKLYLEYGCSNLEELLEKIGKYYDDFVAEAGADVASDEYKSKRAAYIAEYSEIVLEKDEYIVKAPIKKVNFVNIASYPNATKTDAFSSAYAVIKSLNDVGTLTEEQAAVINSHYSKCVDIIYALNNDPQLRNLLQYGYVGTNYNFIKDAKHQNTNYITLRGEASADNPVYYNMNLFHTGNPYIAYYCEALGWNATVHSNVLKQNAASYTLLDKLTEEASNVSELDGTVFDLTDDEEDVLDLWDNGFKHGDVTITWECNSDDIEIVDNLLRVKDTGIDPQNDEEVNKTESINITVIANLTCIDAASGESLDNTVEFTVTLIRPVVQTPAV